MFGNILIVLAIATSFFTVIMYYKANKGFEKSLNYARLGYLLTSVLIILTSSYLLHLILSHNYQYKYVYDYSNSDLSIGLLMSTFYAGQEGSFLIWVFFTAIIGLVLQQYLYKRAEYEPAVMMVFTSVLAFLLIMINPLLKSPFSYIWTDGNYVDIKNINQAFLNLPFLKEFLFSDSEGGKTYVKMTEKLVEMLSANGIIVRDFIILGKGLNPLLQNFWMQIHPPILFIGFALGTVPYAFAIASLICSEYKKWLEYLMPWNLIGIMVLGTAIMLGGYWAYGILGWGGYWGWDPVENASLIPWLIWVAVVHTSLIQLKSQKETNPVLLKTNLLLSAFVFVFIVYSTFLTRSGVLQDASVHSFVTPGRLVFIFLLIFILTIMFVPILAFIKRKKSLDEFKAVINYNISKETSLLIGAIIILASAIVIFVGTSLPIIGGTVDISFYNKMNYPLMIILTIINGLSVFIAWKNFSKTQFIKKVVISSIVSSIITIAIVVLSDYYFFMYILLMWGSVLTIVLNLVYMANLHAGIIKWGAFISHIGIGVFFIGVLISGYFSKEEKLDLELNVKQKSLGYNLTYKGYKLISGTEKYSFLVEVEKLKSKKYLRPVLFYSDFNNSINREPDLIAGTHLDLYITPISFETAEQKSNGKEISLNLNQEVLIDSILVKFIAFDLPENAMESMQQSKEFNVGVKLELKQGNITEEVNPFMKTDGKKTEFISEESHKFNKVLKILDMSAGKAIKILVADKADNEKNKDTFSIQFSTKPLMSFVWYGVFLMMFGFILSTINKIKIKNN